MPAPSPVTMHKTSDGQIFENKEAARFHEYELVVTAAVRPAISVSAIMEKNEVSADDLAAYVATVAIAARITLVKALGDPLGWPEVPDEPRPGGKPNPVPEAAYPMKITIRGAGNSE